MNIPLVLVDDLFAEGKMDHVGGHGAYYRHHGDPEDGPLRGLHFICPKCGQMGAISIGQENGRGWTHDGNWEKPTCTPSILHDSPRCGWHGYLTKGEFVPC